MRDQLAKTTQVRIRPRNIVDGHSGGSVVWMTPSRARMFASMGVIDVIGDPNIPLGDKKVDEGDPGKKSFDAPSNGHSIGSASSHENGKDQQSSALVVDPASPLLNAAEFEMLASSSELSASEQSPSTTPTGSRRGQTSTTSPTLRGGSATRRKTTSRVSRG